LHPYPLNIEILEVLLGFGCSMKSFDKNGRTPMEHAVMTKDKAMVESVLDCYLKKCHQKAYVIIRGGLLYSML
jgi:hypothetical protein